MHGERQPEEIVDSASGRHAAERELRQCLSFPEGMEKRGFSLLLPKPKPSGEFALTVWRQGGYVRP